MPSGNAVPELEATREGARQDGKGRMPGVVRGPLYVRQKFFAQEQVPTEQAVGRICTMPTVSCPPAIPIVVSGEKITPAAVRLMQKYHVMQAAVLRKTI